MQHVYVHELTDFSCLSFPMLVLGASQNRRHALFQELSKTASQMAVFMANDKYKAILEIGRAPLCCGADPDDLSFVHSIDEFPDFIQRCKERAGTFFKNGETPPRIRVIVDDAVDDPDDDPVAVFSMKRKPKKDRWENTQIARHALYIGRHWGLELVVLSRFLVFQEPHTRKMIESVVAFPDELSPYQKKMLCRYYCPHAHPDLAHYWNSKEAALVSDLITGQTLWWRTPLRV